MIPAILNILIGLWLMIAPSQTPMGETMANNYYIAGPLVITFAITALWEVNRSARYGTLLAGMWLIISAFLLPTSSNTIQWITVVVGALLTIFSLIKGKIKGSYGGGWRSLFQQSPLHMQKQAGSRIGNDQS